MIDHNRHRKTQQTVNINIAPLVEVMLVLIVIFMITAPTLNVGVQVDLPKTSASALNDSKHLPVVVSIDKSEQIFVSEKKVSLDELVAQLPQMLQKEKTDTVYVRGDKDIAYGKVMEIMGIIAASGSCKVSLISEPQSKQRSSKLKF